MVSFMPRPNIMPSMLPGRATERHADADVVHDCVTI